MNNLLEIVHLVTEKYFIGFLNKQYRNLNDFVAPKMYKLSVNRQLKPILSKRFSTHSSLI